MSRPPHDAVATGRRVVEIERDAVAALVDRLGDDFERAVALLVACEGRVVVTGMGKSGQVYRKIATTLASTGTASFFLHAAEGAHGDIGMLARGDVCVAISNSGTTDELLALLPSIKRLSLPMVAITGGLDSPLAEAADAVLDVSIEREACPMNLAPTASTTATLAMGDALAVAVLEAKGFTDRDFAERHPGGALGAKLLLVDEIAHGGDELPLTDESTVMRDALERMTAGGLGTVGVVAGDGRLVGVITDGDVRRAVLARGNLDGLTARDTMSPQPKTVASNALAAEALAIMERHSITALFTVDEDGRPTAIVHLHDLLRSGVA